MAKHVVKVAQFRYRDPDGRRKIAYRGDEIEVTGDERQRAVASGVFDQTAVVGAVLTAATVQTLSGGIESRIPSPPEPEGFAPLHHDVLALPEPETQLQPDPVAEAVAEPLPELTSDSEPVVAPQAEPGLKRPVNAASVDVWREYVKQVRPDLADAVDGLSKDELKAAVPKEG